jgi:hypothetical protein
VEKKAPAKIQAKKEPATAPMTPAETAFNAARTKYIAALSEMVMPTQCTECIKFFEDETAKLNKVRAEAEYRVKDELLSKKKAEMQAALEQLEKDHAQVQAKLAQLNE